MLDVLYWLFVAWLVLEGANVVLRRLRAWLEARSAEEDARHKAEMRDIAQEWEAARLTPEDAAQLLAAIDSPPAATPRSIEAVRLYRERVVAADDAGKPWQPKGETE